MIKEEDKLKFATQSRIQLEQATKIIFPEVEQGIKTALRRLKKEFQITEEEQNKVIDSWSKLSEVLHGEDISLVQTEIKESLSILRDLMLRTNDLKKEYEIDGLIYYRLIFSKSLEKQLEKYDIKFKDEENSLEEWYIVNNRVDNPFSNLYEHELFIQKEYFHCLNNEPQMIDCLLSLNEDNGDRREYFSLSLKESFFVNELTICSNKQYHPHHHKNEVDSNCIGITIECEEGSKIDNVPVVKNEQILEYKANNGLILYKIDILKDNEEELDSMCLNIVRYEESFYILKEHYEVLTFKPIKVRLYDTHNDIKLSQFSYYYVKKTDDNLIVLSAEELSQTYDYDNDIEMIDNYYQVKTK